MKISYKERKEPIPKKDRESVLKPEMSGEQIKGESELIWKDLRETEKMDVKNHEKPSYIKERMNE